MRTSTSLFVLVSVTPFLLANPATSQDFSGLVVFGDSNSDTGNRPSPSHYYEDRFSNGPIWVDQLAQALGLPDPVASDKGGLNYAVAGATTGSIELNTTRNTDQQVAQYLASHSPSSEELFILWGGENDFNARQSSGAEPVRFLGRQIQDLADAGARHFLVGNLSPFVGFGALGARREFNELLAEELVAIRQSDPTLTIHELDFSALVGSIFSDPSDFGFTQTTAPACSNCGFGGGISEPAIIASDPAAYFFWDDVHVTTSAHQHIADAAFCAIRVSGRSDSCNFVGGSRNIGRDLHWDDVNAAAAGIATQSSDFSERFAAVNAIDLDRSTIARTSPTESEHWWQVDLAEPMQLHEIRIVNGNSGGRNLTEGGGLRVEVVLADESVTWQQDFVGTEIDGVLSMERPRAEPVSGQTVRLRKLDPVLEGSRGDLRLREVELLTDAPEYTMASSDTWFFDVDAEDGVADGVEINGRLRIDDSRLIVTLRNGELAAGDAFDLLDFQELSGEFANIELPSLGSTLQWHMADLYTDGLISVTFRGDFDNSGGIDTPDIDLLTAARGASEAKYDLTGDGVVDDVDRAFWVTKLAETAFGDANLDGQVDMTDFLSLSTSFSQAGGWGQGDFDGDGQIQFSDFVVLADNFGKEIPAMAIIPEPSSFGLAGLGLLGCLLLKRCYRSTNQPVAKGGPADKADTADKADRHLVGANCEVWACRRLRGSPANRLFPTSRSRRFL